MPTPTQPGCFATWWRRGGTPGPCLTPVRCPCPHSFPLSPQKIVATIFTLHTTTAGFKLMELSKEVEAVVTSGASQMCFKVYQKQHYTFYQFSFFFSRECGACVCVCRRERERERARGRTDLAGRLIPYAWVEFFAQPVSSLHNRFMPSSSFHSTLDA